MIIFTQLILCLQNFHNISSWRNVGIDIQYESLDHGLIGLNVWFAINVFSSVYSHFLFYTSVSSYLIILKENPITSIYFLGFL